MKMLKRIALPVLLLTVLALCFALVSCEKECKHEYGEWTVTKAATCTENGEQVRTCTLCEATETQLIASTGHASEDLLCGACGEEIVGAGSLVPDLDYVSISSVGLVIKDVLITDAVEEYPENGSVTSVELAELVIYSDEDGMLKGYGEGEAVTTYGDGTTDTAEIVAVLEGETVYVRYDVYGKVGYFTSSLSSLIESNPQISESIAMIETLLPSIEVWLSESLLPCFTTPSTPIETPELSEEEVNAALTAILDLFFKVEKTDDGFTVALDLSIVKEVNDALNEKTVAQLIDLIAGEGTFLQLQIFLPRILNFSVNDLVTFLSLNLGVDIPALLTSLDELAVIVTGSEGATFEALVGLETDIGSLLSDEEFLATSVKDVLMASLELSTEEELNAAISETVSKLNTTTLYALLEVDPELPGKINEAVDSIAEALSYEITVGKDGKFVRAELSVNVTDTAISLVITSDKISFNAHDDAGTNTATVELILNYEMTVDEDKITEIKSYFDNLPAIEEEMLSLGDNVLLIYDESNVLVGALLYNYAECSAIDGELASLKVNVQILDFTEVLSVSATLGCGTKYEYSYVVTAWEEERIFTVPLSEVEGIEDVDAYALALLESDAEYTVSTGTTYGFSVIFAYDAATGEPVESADHDYQCDEEQSVYASEVDCGEKYFSTYVCADCGDVYKDEYVKKHGQNMVKTSVSFDEASGVYTVKYACSCGEQLHTLKVTVLGSEVALTATSTTGEASEAFSLEFTIETDGIYDVAVFSNAEEGYVHFFNPDYTDTVYYDGDGTANQTSFTEGKGRLSLYAYSYVNVTEITVTISLAD